MLVRLILWLIVGFLIYTVFQVIKKTLQKPSVSSPEKTVRGEEMVLDPVCGTYVPRNDALKIQDKGTVHYFCSTDCRDKHQQRS